MPQNWQDNYSELKDFISAHPEVIIEKNHMRIPDTARPEFYGLFDALRSAFIQEKAPNIVRECGALSRSYMEVEAKAISLLKLDEVSMMPGLGRFLHDPGDQLRRSIYDLLFDLLKGKIDTGLFEAVAARNINDSFTLMYRLGYEKWVSMSLIKLLEADELLRVILPELSLYDAHKSGGIIKEELPEPEKMSSIVFEFEPDTACNIADFIVHSPKTGKYVSTRSQFGEPFGVSTNVSEKREWLPSESMPALEAGLVLLCQGDNAYEVSLFGDSSRICRPDIVLVSQAFRGWYGREGLQKAQAYHQGLKPLLGTFVISMDEVPEMKPEEQIEGISIITAGLDSAKLIPVVDALAQPN